MVLKSRDYVFKMSVFKKLSIVLYSVVHVHVSLRAAVVANQSITVSVLEVSDRWMLQRHSRRFSSIEALSAV